jgi:protoporphyrinogen oxidase
VGAGLTGLACAKRLREADISSTILEATDSIGGRVRTDHVDGFLLDRGFQVFLTAYPEAKQVLDYPKLDLQEFFPGALIRVDHQFHQIADPFRFPLKAVQSLLSPIGTLSDKIRVARLVQKVQHADLDHPPIFSETSTLEALRQFGFSEMIITRFFRPFWGGVFLDVALSTSSRIFEFLLRMFSQGAIALPASGMESIPQQLAANLYPESIATNTPVFSVKGTQVILDSGDMLQGKAVVIATEGPAAAQLVPGQVTPDSQSVTTLYFVSNEIPFPGPFLILNGEGKGPINHMCVVSQIASSYAPPGLSLVSVTVLESTHTSDQELMKDVRTQLKDWFGPMAEEWRHIRTYQIPYALPSQLPPFQQTTSYQRADLPGIFVCGDHVESATHHGALRSGRLAAKSVITFLKG